MQQIIIILDGSPASLKAAEMALEIARVWNYPVRAIYLIDSGLRNILGDEWLSNASIRINFHNWFESNLHENIESTFTIIKDMASAHKIALETETIIGKPDVVITRLGNLAETHLLILPNPKSKNAETGSKLYLKLDKIMGHVSCPVLIASKET